MIRKYLLSQFPFNNFLHDDVARSTLAQWAAKIARRELQQDSGSAWLVVTQTMIAGADANKQQAKFRSKARLAISSTQKNSLELMLLETSRQVCTNQKIIFNRLTPIQRLFIMHYRCHVCGLLPLYRLDLLHLKRVRCTKCTHLVSFRGAGKYGKIRKEIAFAMKRRWRHVSSSKG